MKKQLICNICAIFFSVVLSIVLISFSVFATLYFSVTVLTQPKTIVKVVQSVDYKTVITQNKTLNQTVENFGVNAQVVDNIIKSEQASDIIEKYADDVLDILAEIPEEKKIDFPMIQHLVDENIDTVLQETEENMKIKIPKKQVKRQVKNVIKQNEKVVKQVIPVIEPIRTVVQTVETYETVKNAISRDSFWLLLFDYFMIAVMICIIKYKNFKGFIWLSVDFLISALTILCVIIFSKTNYVKLIAKKISYFDEDVIVSTVSLCVDKLNIGFIICLSLFVICAVVYATRLIIIKFKNKKLNLQA